MGETTRIAWTDATWNPWQGCRKVNLDCRGCYMYRDKARYGQDPKDIHRSAAHTFNLPLRLKEPAKVFVCSWSDFFIEEADAWRSAAWDIIRRCPHLTFQIPTKRPERIAQCLPQDWGKGWPNVWLGVSAGHLAAWEKFVPILQSIPAALRWVSVEPQIERFAPPPKTLVGLSWLVVGGASGGKDSPPFEEAWAMDWILLRRPGLWVYIKQLGSVWAHRNHSRDPWAAGAHLFEWPAYLRVREFPAVPEVTP